jgi:molecular chaperone HscB
MTERAPYRRTRFLRQASRNPDRLPRHVRNAHMPHSYFAMFELEPRFALPLEQLDLAYRALAMRVHPDRYANAPLDERRQALVLTADANDAYRTLKKPHLRAQHLLRLRGIDTAERNAAMPPSFLTTQMEWREALGEARAARDDNALRQLGAAVRAAAAVLHGRLERQLDVEQDNAAAAQSVLQLMFMDKLLADIDDAHALLEA